MTRVARLELDGDRRVYVELADGRGHVLDRAPWAGGRRTGEALDAVDELGRCDGARRLPPVEPSKIVCVGRNYRAHAEELGNTVPAEPLLFLKPPSSLIGPDDDIELPPPQLTQRVEHEVEVGIVIGERVRRASEAQAAAAIWGATIVGDVTARDLQRSDKQWTRAKGFDTFCPTGPVVVAGLDTSALSVRCVVNDALRQDGNTGAMAFSPAFIVAFISQVMTLEPGDLIATGTPAGVGPLEAGDRVRFIISGIGELAVGVRRRGDGG